MKTHMENGPRLTGVGGRGLPRSHTSAQKIALEWAAVWETNSIENTWKSSLRAKENDVEMIR